MTLKRAIKYSVSKVRNTHYVFRIRSQNLETNHKNLNVKCSQCKASVRLYVLVVIRSCRCRRREMNHRRKPSYIGFFVESDKVFVCAVSVHINQSPVAVSQSSPPSEIRPAIGKGVLCARTPRALGKRNSAAATGRNFQSGPSVLSPSHIMLIENWNKTLKQLERVWSLFQPHFSCFSIFISYYWQLIESRIWKIDWYWTNDLDLCLEVVSRSRQPLRHIRHWISWKPLEIEAWFQWTTNRKWPISNRMVTWATTSRDPERLTPLDPNMLLAQYLENS